MRDKETDRADGGMESQQGVEAGRCQPAGRRGKITKQELKEDYVKPDKCEKKKTKKLTEIQCALIRPLKEKARRQIEPEPRDYIC